MNIRIGFGYDIHKLVKGRKLIIGGIDIPWRSGEAGYSDGDALIHAIIDALLGASGLDDIGTHFPSGNPEYRDISSMVLLGRTITMITDAGFRIGNLDCTVILQKPPLAPFKKKIEGSIAEVLHIPAEMVNIKAKTKDYLDAAGKGRAIESYAAVILEKM